MSLQAVVRQTAISLRTTSAHLCCCTMTTSSGYFTGSLCAIYIGRHVNGWASNDATLRSASGARRIGDLQFCFQVVECAAFFSWELRPKEMLTWVFNWPDFAFPVDSHILPSSQQNCERTEYEYLAETGLAYSISLPVPSLFEASWESAISSLIFEKKTTRPALEYLKYWIDYSFSRCF